MHRALDTQRGWAARVGNQAAGSRKLALSYCAWAVVPSLKTLPFLLELPQEPSQQVRFVFVHYSNCTFGYYKVEVCNCDGLHI